MKKYYTAELVENIYVFSHNPLTAKQALTHMKASIRKVSIFVKADYDKLVKEAEVEDVKMCFDDLISIIETGGDCPYKQINCSECEYNIYTSSYRCFPTALYIWATKTLKGRHHE